MQTSSTTKENAHHLNFYLLPLFAIIATLLSLHKIYFNSNIHTNNGNKYEVLSHLFHATNPNTGIPIHPSPFTQIMSFNEHDGRIHILQRRITSNHTIIILFFQTIHQHSHLPRQSTGTNSRTRRDRTSII